MPHSVAIAIAQRRRRRGGEEFGLPRAACRAHPCQSTEGEWKCEGNNAGEPDVT